MLDAGIGARRRGRIRAARRGQLPWTEFHAPVTEAARQPKNQ
jgi:hypothetical protein